MIFKTDRLELSEAVPDDKDFFFKLLNSPNWIEYIGDRKIKSLFDAEKYIRESLINSYKCNGFGLYKISLKESKLPIGICGLLKRPHLEHPDIGYAILPEYEKKGYAYEAAKGTMIYAETILRIQKILAITAPKNKSSIKVLEKIKLKFVKRIKFKEDEEELLLYSN